MDLAAETPSNPPLISTGLGPRKCQIADAHRPVTRAIGLVSCIRLGTHKMYFCRSLKVQSEPGWLAVCSDDVLQRVGLAAYHAFRFTTFDANSHLACCPQPRRGWLQTAPADTDRHNQNNQYQAPRPTPAGASRRMGRWHTCRDLQRQRPRWGSFRLAASSLSVPQRR